MNKLEPKKKKRLQIAFALALLILITIFFSNSKSELLEDDAEVKPKTNLTYYLNVSYDGVDKNGVQSDDTKVSKINSGTIFVEDKIPDGLEFIGFVTTADGTIGAVKRDDESMCAGKVLDDTHEESIDTGVWNDTNTEYTYHGLHYDATTRTVTFKVKNIQAGCKLTVGIITKTPPLDDPDTPVVETRRDFYNFATARERTLNKKSNTVHVFMGKSNVVLQNVTYIYTGDVPENAPELPETASYTPGASVGIASDAKMEGYTFSGWETTNATIENNSFYMPTEDVILQGSFTRIPDYKVTYTVTGDTPEDYVTPREERYYPETVVELDTLKEGDIINGYRFLGWNSTDVEITADRDFSMPEQDVTVTGSFEEEQYNVSYAFYDGIKPPDADNLLPETKRFKPGDTVELDNNITEPEGYEFLGWYEDDEFEMPNEDVVVLGEWKASRGIINLSMNMEIDNPKDYYSIKDEVHFRITVTNNNSFAVSNVMIKELLDGVEFSTVDDNLTQLSDHIININNIESGRSVSLIGYYTIKRSDKKTIENKVEIIGATAENGFELPEENITASASFKVQPSIKLCVETTGLYNENTFQFEVGVEYFKPYSTSLVSGQCKILYIEPNEYNEYKIKEIVPQEYTITNIQIVGENVIDSEGEFVYIWMTEDSDEQTITFVNTFRKSKFFHSSGRADNIITTGVG